MRIYSELDLNTFEAWNGAVKTLFRIRREGKCEELESVLEENYPEGIDETELNDLLWFDSETVYEWVGLRTESEIESEIEEAKLPLLRKGLLTNRRTKEPIDWLNIVENNKILASFT